MFGWKDVRHGRKLLQIFQIGSLLETLTLMDAQRNIVTAFPVWVRGEWVADSSEIFKALHDRVNGTSPGPFISMRRRRSLVCFKSDTFGETVRS